MQAWLHVYRDMHGFRLGVDGCCGTASGWCVTETWAMRAGKFHLL